MEFSANNNVVRICLRAMALADQGSQDQAKQLFAQAWSEAQDALEKFITAFFMAKNQGQVLGKLRWLEITLDLALRINDDTVKSALPLLYTMIAQCLEETNHHIKAEEHYALAASCDQSPTDQGPFYHGTKADLQVGDSLTAGGISNYHAELRMNHIYFTGLIHGAGLAAELAKGEERPRVYAVEPTGPFENDPNVTNQKFPGNPTRSYRSVTPLKVIGEVVDWQRMSPEELKRWHERLAISEGEIIN